MTLTTILKRAMLATVIGLMSTPLVFAHGGDGGGGGGGGRGGTGQQTRPGGFSPHTGPSSGQTPVLVPYVCQMLGTSPDGFAGYINVAGVKGLVYDFQTDYQVPATPSASVGASASFGSPVAFKSISFDMQGDCDPCSGPWIFVTTVDFNNDVIDVFGATCADGTTTTSKYPGFVHKTLTPGDFDIDTNSIANFAIQLFPTDAEPHDTRITNVAFNGRVLQRNTRTLFNFCPLGFCDHRPAFSCGFDIPGLCDPVF